MRFSPFFLFLIGLFGAVSALRAQVETWTSQDIGAVSPAGSSSYNAGNDTFTVTGSGADIWGTADAFQFVHRSLPGNGVIVARVASIQNTQAWSKAGVMLRESTAAGSRHAMLVVTPGNGVSFQRRLTTNGSSVATTVGAIYAPVWLKLELRGDLVIASYSSNGTSWTVLGTDTLPVPATLRAGLVVSSVKAGYSCTATFTNVALTQSSAKLPPAPWLDADIGGVPTAGASFLESGTYSVYGSGGDIWGTADQFHYLYQPFTGDGQITVRVTSQQNTYRWAKAGLMLRESLNAGSKQALLAVTPTSGLVLQYRYATDGPSSSGGSVSLAAPRWLRFERLGGIVRAWQSADGAQWTSVGEISLGMGTQIYAGLPVASQTTGLSRVTMDNLTISPQPAHPLPQPWQQTDVGSVGMPGAGEYDTGVFSIYGSGGDIWGTADSFRFASQPSNGDGVIIARVTSVQAIDAWSKAGVMLRDSTAADAPEVSLTVTSSHGITFQRRPATGATTAVTTYSGITAPVWLKLEHYGSYVGASYSADGSTWNYLGWDIVPFATTGRLGLAVTSRHDGTLCKAVFDNVTITTDAGLHGLLGAYYAGSNFETFVTSRIDPWVNFNFGSSAPAPGMPAHIYSMRWQGQVQPRYSDSYTFSTVADDGVRLWVNGQLVIDDWTSHAPTEHSGTITLTAGQRYDLRLDYYDSGNIASVRLDWASAHQTREPIPAQRLFPLDPADTDTDNLPDAWEQKIVDFSATDAIATVAQVLPGDDFDHDGMTNQQEYQAGLDPTNPDTDFDGVSDKQEGLDGTNPNDPASVTAKRIAYFPLDDAGLVSSDGQLPRSTSAPRVLGRKGTGVRIGPAGEILTYDWKRSDGTLNYSFTRGSIRLWVKPDWSSAQMSGTWSRLFQVGGPWGVGKANSQVRLHASAPSMNFNEDDGAGHLHESESTVPIAWTAGTWHQVVATWSPNSRKLYADGVLIGQDTLTWAHAPKVADILEGGLTLGNENTGAQPLKGILDEVESFNYELAPTQITADIATEDSDHDGLSDAQEQALFGNLNHSSTTDTDGDGVSDIDEVEAGTNWNDFWNGQSALISIVSGNDQGDLAGEPLGQPLTVKITNHNGATKAGVPVAFNITAPSGGGTQLTPTNTTTNAGGTAQSLLKLPTAAPGTPVTVSATGAGVSVEFSASIGDPNVDPEAPGVPTITEEHDSTEATVEWEDRSDNETAFYVERRLPGNAWTRVATLPRNSTSYHDTGLIANKVYFYRIVSHNDAS